MTFAQNAKAVLTSIAENAETSRCPDQLVGPIVDFDAKEDDFPYRLPATTIAETQNRRLVLVLESPHKAEFDLPKEPGPAKGKTGKNIRQYSSQIEALRDFTQYPVLLMNAIQYQCSLGFSTRKFRDKVFLKLWSEGGKENFMARLNSYCDSNAVIVNCCTKGNQSQELRSRVHNAIEELQLNATIIKRGHPVTWSIKNRRNKPW